MRPERRIECAEQMILMLARAGRQARSEWGQKVNILINAQIETEVQIKDLAVAQIETEAQIKDLAAAQIETEAQIKDLAAGQARTDQTLRAFINSLREGRNGKSSN